VDLAGGRGVPVAATRGFQHPWILFAMRVLGRAMALGWLGSFLGVSASCSHGRVDLHARPSNANLVSTMRALVRPAASDGRAGRDERARLGERNGRLARRSWGLLRRLGFFGRYWSRRTRRCNKHSFDDKKIDRARKQKRPVLVHGEDAKKVHGGGRTSNKSAAQGSEPPSQDHTRA